MPPQWSPQVWAFIDRLKATWDVRCVILHGSFATGKWTDASDLDLVVIADGLPDKFLDRLRMTSDLLPRRVPIETLCYTQAEFANMLESLHVTALEAVFRGVPLLGVEYFSSLKAQLDTMIAKGLRRGRVAWYWEESL